MAYARARQHRPAAGNDVFISGVERFEPLDGGCVRVVLYVQKGEVPERKPAPFDVIMPLDALPDAVGKALATLGTQVLVRPDGSTMLKH
jgi:hypothetical protein